jgi:hypothetical protein
LLSPPSHLLINVSNCRYHGVRFTSLLCHPHLLILIFLLAHIPNVLLSVSLYADIL